MIFTGRVCCGRLIDYINLAFIMKRYLVVALLTFAGSGGLAYSQTKPIPDPSPRPAQPSRLPQRPATGFEISDYGVEFQADPRLIIVMAALEAAGFDPTPPGGEPSVFRAQVRRDQTDLDPDLRNRLRTFYERNRLPAPAPAADQAARYVSLAFALGPPPALDAPEKSEELPGSLLEVLDFAPLIREFYRHSGIDKRLVAYTRAYQSEGDRLRQPAAEMVRAVLTYLHTRPIRVSSERVLVKAPTAARKKSGLRTYSLREHERRFFIVPDLLGAPGAINLRVIGDEYYAIVPEGTDPASSQLRRAYIQYVIDPLMLRFNKEIAARREPLRQLLKARESEGENVTPDVFIATSRSLVAAADVQFNELVKLQRLSLATQDKLGKAKDDATRAVIAREAQAARNAIHDETVAEL